MTKFSFILPGVLQSHALCAADINYTFNTFNATTLMSYCQDSSSRNHIGGAYPYHWPLHKKDTTLRYRQSYLQRHPKISRDNIMLICW